MDNINRCGTHTGYRYHIDKKQTACMDCKKAYADYQKQWRLNNKDKVLIIQRKSYSKNIQKNRESVSKWRLNNLDKNELLECYSAFNGFAIYRKDKFINCDYNNNVFKSHGLLDNNLITEKEKYVPHV